jgi:hypothetical protein
LITLVVDGHVQDGSLDIDRPEELRVHKLVDDSTDAHRIQLVFISYQDVLIGEALHVLQEWLFCYVLPEQLLAHVGVETVESFDGTAYFGFGRRREESFYPIYEGV